MRAEFTKFTAFMPSTPQNSDNPTTGVRWYHTHNRTVPELLNNRACGHRTFFPVTGALNRPQISHNDRVESVVSREAPVNAFVLQRPGGRRQTTLQNPCLRLFFSGENACTIPFALTRIENRRWKGLDTEMDTE